MAALKSERKISLFFDMNSRNRPRVFFSKSFYNFART
jgi:hypothetical protein